MGEGVTKRNLYDQLDRLPAHRVPRCTSCRLVLPCRNDGTYGPCDARDVSHESHAGVCELLRAVFAAPASDVADEPEDDDRNDRLAAARTASNTTRPARCKAGHEQSAENIYEGLRNGKYRAWCRVCQTEQYRRKQDEKRTLRDVADFGGLR
jgi:hypothetical protein